MVGGLLLTLLSMVSYSIAYAHHITEAATTFDIPTNVFEQQLHVNTTSVFVAIREAIASFAKLTHPTTFVFVGNMFNEGLLPGWLTLGLGKTASASMLKLADGLFEEKCSR
jgi:hypothetical protein